MKKTLQSTQIALIYQTLYAGSVREIEKQLKDKFSASDEDLSIIPIPSEAPAEIPRIEFKKGNVFIRFSNARADLIVNEEELNDDTVRHFYNIVISLGVTIGRIGYITKNILSDISDDLLKKNLRLEVGNFFPKIIDVKEANWRCNKPQNISNIECNNISNITLGKYEGKHALQFERDVNSNQDTNLSIKDTEKITEFAEKLAEASKDELGLIKE